MNPVLLCVCIFIVAVLYSMVGHAGASGYLAVLGLFGVAGGVMKPAALGMNILVATIGTAQFARAGHFRWRLFWPFALTSVPLAFVGGLIKLPDTVYKPLIGVVLLYSAVRLFWTAWPGREAKTKGTDLAEPSSVAPARELAPPPLPVALMVGAVLGFVSGMTGVGGGIFLSPIMLLFRWAGVKETAAVSAAFILVNSISGLLGVLQKGNPIPAGMWGTVGVWGLAAVVGGAIGSRLGARHLAPPILLRVLAVVLVIAGVKLIVG